MDRNSFEAALRFVLERDETYTESDGPEVTQFGIYQMTMEPGKELLSSSAGHRERRIQAMIALAERECLIDAA